MLRKRAIEKKKRLIPLLVNGAEMPSKECLPEEMQAMTLYQSAKLRDDRDFRRDIEGLRKLLTPWYKRGVGLKFVVLGVLGVFAVLGVKWSGLFATGFSGEVESPSVEPSHLARSGVVVDKAVWVKGSTGDDRKMPLLDVVISNHTGAPFVVSQYRVVVDRFKTTRSGMMIPSTSIIRALDKVKVILPEAGGVIEEHLDNPVNVVPNGPMRLKFEFSVERNGVCVSPSQLGGCAFRLQLLCKGMDPIEVGRFELQ